MVVSSVSEPIFDEDRPPQPDALCESTVGVSRPSARNDPAPVAPAWRTRCEEAQIVDASTRIFIHDAREYHRAHSAQLGRPRGRIALHDQDAFAQFDDPGMRRSNLSNEFGPGRDYRSLVEFDRPTHVFSGRGQHSRKWFWVATGREGCASRRSLIGSVSFRTAEGTTPNTLCS